MKKKLNLSILLLTLIMVIYMLSACNKETHTSDSNSKMNHLPVTKEKDPTTPTTDTNIANTEADLEMNPWTEDAESIYLRTKIQENSASVGIAYIDYLPQYDLDEEYTEIELVDYIANSKLGKQYPYLCQCPIIRNNGNHLFAIVPANADSMITVYKSYIDTNGNIKADEDNILFRGDCGDTVILYCNESDSYSNVLVTVTDGDKTIELHPMLSLERPRTIASEYGVYDFSLKDIRSYVDEARNYLIDSFPEIYDEIENGKTLNYLNEMYFYTDYVLCFGLTSDQETDSDMQDLYYIDFDHTYTFDPEKNAWYIIGGGLDFALEP